MPWHCHSKLQKGYVQREMEPRRHCLTFPKEGPEASFPTGAATEASSFSRGRDLGLTFNAAGAEFCKNLWDREYHCGHLWNMPSAIIWLPGSVPNRTAMEANISPHLTCLILRSIPSLHSSSRFYPISEAVNSLCKQSSPSLIYTYTSSY